MTPRVPTPDELADDFAEIRDLLVKLTDEIKRTYVPRELYEAKHTAMRSETALEISGVKAAHTSLRQEMAGEMARIQMELKDKASVRSVAASDDKASRAVTISMWCLGIFGTSVIAAVVGFLSSGGQP